MKTQRERLLELIDKLPDDKLADVSFAVEQIGRTSEFKARLINQAFEIRERMQQSLNNVPEIEGSRPDLRGGESWTTNERDEAVDPFFAIRWHEDDGATHVQKAAMDVPWAGIFDAASNEDVRRWRVVRTFAGGGWTGKDGFARGKVSCVVRRRTSVAATTQLSILMRYLLSSRCWWRLARWRRY